MKATVRHNRITINVTAEVDVDDLTLTPEDLGGLSSATLAPLLVLREYAEHRLDCNFHTVRFCSCGLDRALAALDEALER